MQLGSEERQKVIDSASILLRLAFPLKGPNHLYSRWAECQKYIQHGISSARWFERLTSAGQEVASSPSFISCITDCAWYLIEVGNGRDACSVLEIALNASESKLDLEESHLLNALGMAYFHLNQLPKCHKALIKSLRIRESILEPNDLYLAASFQNIGNIESAEGNFESAIRNFEKSISIREAHDNDSSGDLTIEMSKEEKNRLTSTSTAYLSKARAHLGAKDYDLTISSLRTSQIFWERAQSQSALEYFANYLYGNLYLATQDYDAAIAIYQKTLEHVQQRVPGSSMEVSIHYKISIAEFRKGNLEAAMSSLSTELQKVRLKQDCLGHQARMFRRKAQIIKYAQERGGRAIWLDSVDTPSPEELMSRADGIRRQLQGARYLICETKDEETCFETLVSPFER
ncbi:hypothetical protein ONZ43_g3526 [Nemania bipapillata]|uniref:Uncharacterized protein n=1 Tax=Nemania bipapillata TaxID=110536 RepID=A0ACC2IWK7_9PEZI|nr:hypothetical protein ONZ43_g3526 [Nemania bipapillata]